jgi:hypothetical protein
MNVRIMYLDLFDKVSYTTRSHIWQHISTLSYYNIGDVYWNAFGNIYDLILIELKNSYEK